MGQNFQRINFLLQRLFLALSRREIRNPGVEGPGQPFFLRAAMSQAQGWMANPMKAFNTHIQFWQNTTALYAELTQAMLSGAQRMPKAPGDEAGDARFADEEWDKHPFFYYLKRQYQIMSAYLESLADGASEGEDEKHSEQIHFFTHQLVDLFSPANFLASNPVAIKKAVETNGRSLVEGLENLVKDLERSGGDLLVTLVRSRRVQGRRNPCHRKRPRRPRNRPVPADPLRADDREGLCPPADADPALDQQILHPRPAAEIIAGEMAHRTGLRRLHHLVEEPARGTARLRHGQLRPGRRRCPRCRRSTTLHGNDGVNVVGYCIGGTTLALDAGLARPRRSRKTPPSPPPSSPPSPTSRTPAR